MLYAHSDAETVRALYEMNPKLEILWAHAGMDAPPRTIGALLQRYPTLCAELSVRAQDIAPNGQLAPAWRELFLRYPDRFLIGTDTSRQSRWQSYLALVAVHRRWLAQLPPAIAQQIAYGNATRLFGPVGH